jgi:predicted PurR-regulated permease PerM
LKRPLAWGRAAVVGLTGGALLFVLVLYLLLDGKSVYAWLLAYVPREHRKKMAETIPEVSEVVVAYVQGQILTSLLYGLFAFAVLTALRVPASVPLALLAAAGDVVPVLGFLVSAGPAALLALTVSPLTAGVVITLYSLYHLLENYVIIPRVYGKRLRLSGLAVLAALIIGGSLFGIPGVLLVLPVVAAYPIVERVWLQDSLSDEVLKDHSALEAAALNGKSDRVVEKVLRGEKHSADAAHEVSGRRARAASD